MGPVPIRVVIADHHAVVVKSLESLLSGEPDLQVVATCETGRAAVEAVQRTPPDVLLLDLGITGPDALEVLGALKTRAAAVRVVLLTTAIDDAQMLEALLLGVAGVFPKEKPPHLMLQCIRQVHAGEQWLEVESMARAAGRLLQQKATERELLHILTPRELEITRMVAQGLRTRIVAARLSVSEGTIKTHLHNIYEKLGVGGRAALIAYVRDKGLG